MTAKSIKASLERLAIELLAKAEAAESTHDKLDIFKTVSAFHIANAKVAKGQPQDDPATPTFGAIKSRINGSVGKSE